MIYLRELVAGAISPWVVLSRSRFSRQLVKFAHTELYTSFDIATVAARQEGTVREEMERHARDEYRHYLAFQDWARRVAPWVAANYGDPDRAEGLDETAVRLSAQGVAAPNRRFRTLGEYMAYVFLSESRAVLQFRLYQLLNAYDRRCRRQIPVLLKDERRHVSYSLRYALRELRADPLGFLRGFVRVGAYIARQDVVDLLKTVQAVGSAAIGFVLYYGVLTPYAFLLRLGGQLRRARIRAWRPARAVLLDEAFWKAS